MDSTSKTAPVLSPTPLPLSNLIAHHIPKSTPPARYPIKYLTYSEMQTRRDHGLCLNCDERDAPAHNCQTKRILLILLDEDYLDLRSHELTKLADQELNIEQEIFSSTLTGATNPISSNIIPNDDPKLLCDKEIFFPNILEVVLEIDPFHVYFTKIKSDDLNHTKTAFDIVFSVGCCLTLGFCNASVSSFLQKIRIGDAHNLFVKMIEPYFVVTMVSKPLIFDPGGNIEFVCLLGVRLHDYAQLNHNPRSTISTPLPPIYDLEDKVIFKRPVMIWFSLLTTTW